jgi:hypothetical protein
MQGGQIENPLNPLEIAVAQALLIYDRYQDNEGMDNLDKELKYLNEKDSALVTEVQRKESVLKSISQNLNIPKDHRDEIKALIEGLTVGNNFKVIQASLISYQDQLEKKRAKDALQKSMDDSITKIKRIDFEGELEKILNNQLEDIDNAEDKLGEINSYFKKNNYSSLHDQIIKSQTRLEIYQDDPNYKELKKNNISVLQSKSWKFIKEISKQLKNDNKVKQQVLSDFKRQRWWNLARAEQSIIKDKLNLILANLEKDYNNKIKEQNDQTNFDDDTNAQEIFEEIESQYIGGLQKYEKEEFRKLGRYETIKGEIIEAINKQIKANQDPLTVIKKNMSNINILIGDIGSQFDDLKECPNTAEYISLQTEYNTILEAKQFLDDNLYTTDIDDALKGTIIEKYNIVNDLIAFNEKMLEYKAMISDNERKCPETSLDKTFGEWLDSGVRKYFNKSYTCLRNFLKKEGSDETDSLKIKNDILNLFYVDELGNDEEKIKTFKLFFTKLVPSAEFNSKTNLLNNDVTIADLKLNITPAILEKKLTNVTEAFINQPQTEEGLTEDNFKENYKLIFQFSEQKYMTVYTKLLLSMNGLAGAFIKIWDANDDTVLQQNTIQTDEDNKKITFKAGGICKYTNEDVVLGPFKGVFDSKTNTDVFEFIRDDYKMFQEIGFETVEGETKKNKNFRLFAFGYSGSGKTYTLIQGRPEDPSVMAKTLEYLMTPLPEPDTISNEEEPEIINRHEDVNFTELNIKIYYPLTDKDFKIDDIEINKAVDSIKELKLGANFGNEVAVKVQELIDQVESYMVDNLYIVPTTNNPNSSRAFTLYEIVLSNGGNIYFTDMPGNEKTSLIKKDFLFSETFIEDLETIKGSQDNINIISNQMEPTKQTWSHIKVDNKDYKSINRMRILKKEVLDTQPGNRYTNLELFSKETLNINWTNSGLSNYTNIIVDDSLSDITRWQKLVYCDFINIVELLNQKSKGAVQKEINDMKNPESGLVYTIPSLNMMCEFINSFNTQLANILSEKKNPDEFQSYDISKPITAIPKKKSEGLEAKLKEVFNKVFNPIYKKKGTKDFEIDYVSSSKNTNFTENRFFNEDTFNKIYNYAKGKKQTVNFDKTFRTIKNIEYNKDSNSFIFLDKEVTQIENKNLLSPIIYVYFLIMYYIKNKSNSGNTFYNKGNSSMSVFLTYYFTYRIIHFITSQGDGINTALENHKFVFLKRSNFFTDCNPVNSTDKKVPPDYIFSGKNGGNCSDIASDTGKIKFEKDSYEIEVNIDGIDEDFKEIINREYLPKMNKLLYGEAPDKSSDAPKEKFITLIAIKRLEADTSSDKQKARCMFALESLEFANQISGEITPRYDIIQNGGNYLKYHKKRNSMKKSKGSNKRKQSRKRKIIRI